MFTETDRMRANLPTCKYLPWIWYKRHCINEASSGVNSFWTRLVGMVATMRTLLGACLLIFVIDKFQLADGVEVYFQQADVKSPMRVAGVYSVSLMRVTKLNRTAYGLNINITLETNLDEAYAVHIFFLSYIRKCR